MSLVPLSRAASAGVMAGRVLLQRTNTMSGCGRRGGVVFIWIGAIRATPPSHHICPQWGSVSCVIGLAHWGDTQPAKIWVQFFLGSKY
jgi:hypothetical protein